MFKPYHMMFKPYHMMFKDIALKRVFASSVQVIVNRLLKVRMSILLQNLGLRLYSHYFAISCFSLFTTIKTYFFVLQLKKYKCYLC